MSIDKSLRRRGRLSRTRNVLCREERIAQMKADDIFKEDQSPFGLPKLRIVKLVVGKKKKKKAAEGDDKKSDKKKAAKKK